MIVKSCSSDRQDDVSVIDRGDGFSEVRLRRNHAQDAADNGPEGPATTFWTCDEVSFVARGQASVAEVTARFDELWEEHEDDGKTAAEVAREAKAAADEAKGTVADATSAAQTAAEAAATAQTTADEAKQAADTAAASVDEYMDALLGLNATNETEATDAE